MANNKGRKKRPGLIILVIILILIAVVAVRRSGTNNLVISSYDVVEVTRQDMQTDAKGSGVVESEDKLEVYAPASIVIDEIYVENGDEVSVGTPIAKIDKDSYLDAKQTIEDGISEIDQSISSMYSSKGERGIYSSVKGTVKIVNANKNDSIEAVMNKYDYLLVISTDNNMKVEAKVDDTALYEEGDIAYVMVDDKKIESVITEIDPFESTVKVVIKDNKYDVGKEVEVYDENDAKIGSGQLEINVPVYVEATAGKVSYVYVKANDSVSKGAKLIGIKENDASGELISLTEQKEKLQNQLDDLEKSLEDIGLGSDYVVYSPVEGIVDEFILDPYMTVAEGVKMFSVQRTHPLKIEIAIDELDISKVEIGQKVDLKFDALSGDKYQGEVTKINSLGQSVNGVTSYVVTVRIDDVGDILIGMSGSGTILTEKKENVLTVPVEAVQLIDDEYYVIMGEDADVKTVADHKIVTGLNDGAYIEVIEGLSDGDTVAVPKEAGIEELMTMRTQ